MKFAKVADLTVLSEQTEFELQPQLQFLSEQEPTDLVIPKVVDITPKIIMSLYACCICKATWDFKCNIS